MTNKTLHILLVEDNKGDVILTLDIFQDLLMNNSVSVVDDGEQAIRYLNNKDEFAEAVMPDLILLDINMPRVDGKEVLGYIHQHPHLNHIPVIMLTTSASPNDMEDCYKANAFHYIIKPLDSENFLNAIRVLKKFRFTLVKLSE